jgi:hypothetical protein
MVQNSVGVLSKNRISASCRSATAATTARPRPLRGVNWLADRANAGIRRGARNVDGKARVTKLRLQDAAQAVFVFDYQEGRIARLRSGPAY